jgi:hypothetical protein
MNSGFCQCRALCSTLMLLLAVAIPVAAQSPRDILPLPPSGNVTLPLDEYNRLVALASKPGKRTENFPLNFAIQRATLAFKATDECVLGSVQLEGETYTKNAIKVPLTTNMTILDARQDGKILPLELENGMHTAVLPGAANFDVSLDAGLPLAIEPGRASIHIPVPAAGSARLTLTVLGDHTNVHLSPGIITNRSSSNGQTSIEATLVPGQVVNVSWATREIVAPVAPKEVRFLSDLKSLISVSESDLRLAVLADITVVQGDPTQFTIALPAGYELTSATGPTLDSSETENGVLTLHLTNAAARSHEFLLSLEKSISDSKAEPPFLSFANSQRETGEVLVEGAGTMELTAKETGSLKRMDVKEVSPYLRSLARFPLQAAFRYHRQPNEPPALSLEWTRFPDSSVLAAVAERAVVTTLVTSQGRSLTEIKLTVKNQAQPFLKVDLPTGASIVSAEVAGEKVKPVQGADGARVPLLRERFRPNGPYFVSFVFLHSGAPFAKKGGSDIALPKMDIPINLLQWEVFLPQQYKVKDFGGDALATSLLPPTTLQAMDLERDEVVEYAPPPFDVNARTLARLPGQLGGIVTDPTGAAISGAQITVTNTDTRTVQRAVSDEAGHWSMSNLTSGHLNIVITKAGLGTYSATTSYNPSRPFPISSTLPLGDVNETVTVMAEAITLNTESAQIGKAEKRAKQIAQEQQTAASANVTSLQRRVAGVLPVAVDVPRAGNSYRFVRPLVLDEETKLTFTYKTR